MNAFWNDRKVFVTGGTGFVGAHLIRCLIEKGAKVVCLQNDDNRFNTLDLFGLNGRVTIVKGSVEDFALLEKILNDDEIDAVFHLASQSLVAAANLSPIPTFETNIRGTYFLLEACRKNENVKRIVVASSYKAYGSHENLPYLEDFPLIGLFPYDVSKTCTDLIAQSFAMSYQLPVSIVRSANIYGEGDLNLSRIIPGTIMSVLKNQSPVIRSDGTPVREFIFVDDVVNGFVMLAENIERSAGEAFNFGSDEPINMLDLTNKIVSIMGKEKELPPQVLLKTKIKMEVDAQYLSSEKVAKKLNWRPLTNLDIGLNRTIDWYRAYFHQIT